MFRDLLEFIGYKCRQVVKSRLFPLSLLFLAMFVMLGLKLFRLQILEGEQAQETYTQTTKKTLSVSSTRGNIYDRNGKLLAYNKLVYAVTVTDEGDYSNGYRRNLMILNLIGILDEHEESVSSEIPIVIDSKGNFQYTEEGNSLLRFLRDMYGLESIDDFTDEKPADTTAEEAFQYLKERFGVGIYPRKEEDTGDASLEKLKEQFGVAQYSDKDEGDDTYEVSDADALKCINIRYSMSMNSYQKYVATTVASDISTECMQDILEHSNELLGVEVVEDYVREYTDSECFSHIIGYTGKASTEELEALNEESGEETYVSGDVVGKTGIESYCETELQGTKGERVVYVDSEGRITSVESETEAQTGSDIYLTIDADLTVGIYHLIEQQLAGIILDKLEEGDVTILPTMKSSERKISVKDVYFQLINNNILSMSEFADDDATENEKEIYRLFQKGQKSVLAQMESELTDSSPTAYQDLSEAMQAYMTYTYSALVDEGILLSDQIDTTDKTYIDYRTDEEISLEEFLRYALSQSWIDTTRLDLSEVYTSGEETYQALVQKTLEILEDDTDFGKKIYEQLIDEGTLGGCAVCLALFDQGVLEHDSSAESKLASGNSSTAYEFIREKILNLEITPAQLALDPCSAAVTITDPNTGDVLAMVSYPGYDNNRISDTEYYYQLYQDQSHPLYSSATQTRTAPGSTFKLVSTIAGLEEGVISASDYIQCEGVFKKQGLNLACTGTHGSLNVISAIEKSCNSYFSQVGYLLSLDSTGTYSESLGVEKIQEYAAMVGLSEKSGVEVTEMEPKVSDTAPIPSAIGQGTHTYTNVQLARYVSTIAASGSVMELTLLDRSADADGKTLTEYTNEQVSQMEISDSIWDTVHAGMYRVVHNGSHSDEFNDKLDPLAGKTGTAEENKMRPNHATFVGYTPYDNPEYAIAVTIPYGFSSTYSCRLANSSLELLEGITTLDEILERTAKTDSGSVSED